MKPFWAKPKKPREQITLFQPALTDSIPENHIIRALDAILKEYNWNEWEAHYKSSKGQPPIHPRLLAGALFYGLMLKYKSSRRLEDATRHRIDLIWFLSARTIDHSTFAAFQNKFTKELKSLFRFINTYALEKAKRTFLELAIDGTHIKAYSSRNETRTAQGVKNLLDEAENTLLELFAEMNQQDIEDDPEKQTQEEIQQAISRAKKKCEKLAHALEVVNERDNVRRKKQGERAKPCRVPMNDPEAHVLPNKDGGFAPNFTPIAAVDVKTGLLLEVAVVEGNSESDAVLPAIEEVEAAYEMTPERVAFDGNFADGEILEELAKKEIEAHSSLDELPSKVVTENREKLSDPVAKENWDKLPMRGRKTKRLDRRAFIYSAEEDCYYCPMGRKLVVSKCRNTTGNQQKRTTVYRSVGCGGCALVGRCLSGKSKARTITRDEYQEKREAVSKRRETKSGAEFYKKRSPVAEGVFGFIKRVFGIREFSRVGLEKVRGEWLWICTAYNLKKLLKLLSDEKRSVGESLEVSVKLDGGEELQERRKVA